MSVPQASSSKLLQEMMDDGTFDDLRQRLVTQLKDHVRPSLSPRAPANTTHERIMDDLHTIV